jgi:hypothetical protein
MATLAIHKDIAVGMAQSRFHSYAFHGGMQTDSCTMCNVGESAHQHEKPCTPKHTTRRAKLSPGFALLLVLNAGESRQ